MAGPKKLSKQFRLINVHQVNGDDGAIAYLKDADFHMVEGLFLKAKQTGRAEFEFHGEVFELLKNRDLTYTVQKVPEKVAFVESL